MIISRHKVCDICEEPVGVNKRYFNIKSKVLYVGYAGSVTDNKTHHICEDCMREFAIYLQSKLEVGQLEGKLERPQGEWIIDQEGDKNTITLVTCPFCGERHCCKMNFCGNCGADMRGGAE